MKHRYACPTCYGTREVECGCCGQTTCCTACEDTGLDSALVNIEAFKAARRSLLRTLPLASHCSWAWDEDGVIVGEAIGDFPRQEAGLRYADFPPGGVA